MCLLFKIFDNFMIFLIDNSLHITFKSLIQYWTRVYFKIHKHLSVIGNDNV